MTDAALELAPAPDALGFANPPADEANPLLTLWQGRSGDFTEEKAAKAVSLVFAGVTVEKICDEIGIEKTAFYEWKRRFPKFGNAIERARVGCADAFADRAAEAADEAAANPGERGEMARGQAVKVGHYQWQAERRDPARWGQRSAVAVDMRVAHAGEVRITAADLVAAAARVVQLAPSPSPSPASSSGSAATTTPAK